MKRGQQIVSSLVAMVVLSACTQAAPGAAVPSTPTSARRAPLSATAQPSQANRAIDQIFAGVAADAPGMAVMVTRDGQPIYVQGYGLADRQTGAPIASTSLFHFASAGKQFTGMGLLILAEAGQLSLDDPVSQYLPELAELGDGMTIRRLLQHTSGLPGQESGDDEAYEALRELAAEPTTRELLVLLSDWQASDLVAAPGEAHDYSNLGYEVLGALIERVADQPFGSFMEQRIFAPLGMRDTFSLPNPGRLARPQRARGYAAEDDDFTLYETDPLDNLVGAGSIYTTVEDMARYERALLSNQLVRADTLAQAFAPAQLNDGSSVDYGLGWELSQHAGQDVVSHSGAWVGYTSMYLRVPGERLAIIILANRDDYDLEELALQVVDAVR